MPSHSKLFIVPKYEPNRAIRLHVRHSENTRQFQNDRAARAVVVCGLPTAATIHVRGDQIHLERRGTPNLRCINIFKLPTAGHELMPLDIGVPVALQLSLEPVDGITVALRSLHAVPKLCQSLNARFVAFEVEPADKPPDRY